MRWFLQIVGQSQPPVKLGHDIHDVVNVVGQLAFPAMACRDRENNNKSNSRSIIYCC